MNASFGKYTQFNINCDTKINKYNKEQSICKDIYIYINVTTFSQWKSTLTVLKYIWIKNIHTIQKAKFCFPQTFLINYELYNENNIFEMFKKSYC